MISKTILIGRVGKDPEVRQLQNGSTLATFSMATSESWKDKATGEKKERTEWHRIVTFNEHLAGVIEKYVKKGSKIYVEGTIKSRKWDDDGVEKTAYEIELGMKGKLLLLDKAERSDD